MRFSLFRIIPLLALATAAPTTETKTKAFLIQACAKFDAGKPCNAGIVGGVAVMGVCTSTIINLEYGVFACSVAATSTATAPVASSSVYDKFPTTDKGKQLEYLRRIVEGSLPVL